MSINGEDRNTKLTGEVSLKRNDSGELDVFEATEYFSGYNNGAPYENRTNFTQNRIHSSKDEMRQQRWRSGGRRISLDLPIQTLDPVMKTNDAVFVKEKMGNNLKHKQPSSPGGRFSSFLNSLFNQAGLKRGKSNLEPNPQDEEESTEKGLLRRRRRSSISHFLSSSKTTTIANNTREYLSSKPLFGPAGSGFRTPPPLNTPRKINYKEPLDYYAPDAKQVVKDLCWFDEKLKFMETLSEKRKVWANVDEKVIKSGGKVNGETVDEGTESDSSSDLFELQNYELSPRGGLPVYVSTNAEGIKKTTTLHYDRPI